ncbi:hypothetical protein, partial [Microcoleus sp. herbarium12]|uniref:hypothetical protein n=1 Tax=Microcoleus sp. herbarium12 TaxID=3055437 RepID=UPI003B03FEA8
LAVGSWQLAVGSWQLAVVISYLLQILLGSMACLPDARCPMPDALFGQLPIPNYQCLDQHYILPSPIMDSATLSEFPP